MLAIGMASKIPHAELRRMEIWIDLEADDNVGQK